MGLNKLPYDLLLNIALYLDLSDIHALQLTSKTLCDFATTRPVYRKLAIDLLRRCRALPLKGFQRLTDLTTPQLIRSVHQAARYDRAWRQRAPRPISDLTNKYGTSHYMDGPPSCQALAKSSVKQTWYKVVNAPPDEEVDWLSPITSSYTLCATKSGKVVCWDVQSNTCLAEWNPGPKWELWKCRVEFEERTVYFTMANVIDRTQDDSRVMDFVLMRLTFSDPPSGESSLEKPVFTRVSEFRTMGVVMNIFLLDPSQRLLSAFIWIASSKTIGLYVLPDWDKPEYVFLDTGLDYAQSANWSCILFNEHIVIHCEEPELAYQHFYPFSQLRELTAHMPSRKVHPKLVGRVPPARTLSKKFIFPRIPTPTPNSPIHTSSIDDDLIWLNGLAPHVVILLPSMTPAEAIAAVQMAAISPTSGTSPLPSSTASLPSTSNAPFSLPPSPSPSSTIPIHSQGQAHSQGQSQDDEQNQDSIATPLIITPTFSLPQVEDDQDQGEQTHNPNPFPFQNWFPESAHFVRQWWPTLPGVPRVSCTVVLLAMHDQETHRNRFILAQHYFKVPLDWDMWIKGEDAVIDNNNNNNNKRNGKRKGSENGTTHEYEDGLSSGTDRKEERREEREGDEDMMKMWYVSRPFEVVRVYDDAEDDETQWLERPRPLVAVDFGHAVWIEYCDEGSGTVNGSGNGDLVNGHGDATTESGLEFGGILPDGWENDNDAKVLKFVTFPGYDDGSEWEYENESDNEDVHTSTSSLSGKGKGKEKVKDGEREGKPGSCTCEGHNSGEEPQPLYFNGFSPPLIACSSSQKDFQSDTSKRKVGTKRRRKRKQRETEGVVRTLEVPDELDLSLVETINIDQSQGAVILSDRHGRIFILCYE